MCGIFGYVGSRNDAAKIVFEGLKRLEYRGYDSWGLAVRVESQSGKSKILVEKHVGPIGEVESDSSLTRPERSRRITHHSSLALGHTRWATHGKVSQNNAHPHFSYDRTFVLAQNGIVENYDDLKSKLLKKGYKFSTETDTEVIVRLIEDKRTKSTKGLEDAIRQAFLELGGRNTIIILTKTGEIIACRNGSPLVIGKNNRGDVFFSSDALSFANVCDDLFVVDNGLMVVGKPGQVKAVDIKNGKGRTIKYEKSGILGQVAEKEGYKHFMLKEIYESGKVIRVLLTHGKKSYTDFTKQIKTAKNIYTIGSGTAGVAAAQIAYFLRSIAKIDAVSLVGADAFEYLDLMNRGDLLIAPSQSGETADVLEILEIAKKKGVKIASFVNMPGSMMTKMSDFAFMAQAGPEIAVVSTKVFTSQIAWGYLMSKAITNQWEDGVANLKKVATGVDEFLANNKMTGQLKEVAHFLLPKGDIFLLAKAQNFQIAREGMVKFIETSYKHAHAMPAGDLKHYAITLMRKGVPVIILVSDDEVKKDVLNSASQVKARGSYVIGLSVEKNRDFDWWFKLPDLGGVSSIFNVVVLQLLAYYVGIETGNNVDRPRNIAKSVTVK